MAETCSQTHGESGAEDAPQRGWCLALLHSDSVQCSQPTPSMSKPRFSHSGGPLLCCLGPTVFPFSAFTAGVGWVGGENPLPLEGSPDPQETPDRGNLGRPSTSTPHCIGGTEAQRGHGTCPGASPLSPGPGPAPGFLLGRTAGAAMVGAGGWGNVFNCVTRGTCRLC